MKIRIGTRKSPLAMWQALQTQNLLHKNGYETELIAIASEGDLKLTKPIYELGITGVFTKALDIALLENQIDIAVHSLKDVPTHLAKGLHLTACLPRGFHQDILVYKKDNIFELNQRTIATGSLRRKAFWLHDFPNDTVVDLRGNVQLRIQKLIENQWDGAIFALAGLERSDLLNQLSKKGLQYLILEEMISAPSQGIVGIVSREDLDLSTISDENSMIAATIEREFLRTLQGGCTAPIGGFAKIKKNKIEFEGAVLSLDGKMKLLVEEKTNLADYQGFGQKLAQRIINYGAGFLIEKIN